MPFPGENYQAKNFLVWCSETQFGRNSYFAGEGFENVIFQNENEKRDRSFGPFTLIAL
jgi:hypothetical protein